ncbi:MAG: hypothetical protein AAF388_10010 [Bacteroidota bacterium]
MIYSHSENYTWNNNIQGKPNMGNSDNSTTAYWYALRMGEMASTPEELRKYLLPKEGTLLHTRTHAVTHDGKDKASVRAYFIIKLFQFLQNSTFQHARQNKTSVKIAAVGEFCITLMYLDNHNQDHKYGVTDEVTRAKNRSEYQEAEGAMYRFINQNFNQKEQDLIHKTIRKLFNLYRIGMSMDDHQLTLSSYLRNNPENIHRINEEVDAYVNVDQFVQLFQDFCRRKGKLTPVVQENYLRLLFTRSYLINTVFFQVFAELAIELWAPLKVETQPIINFARIFGMAQQLVNDNCDYLPISYGYSTVCKLPEDTFSDYHRKLFLLPQIFLFQSGILEKENIFEHYAESSLRGSITQDVEQRRVLSILTEKSALSRSKSSLVSFAEYGEKLLKDEEIFRDMFSFVRGNRWYKAYKELS